MFRENVLVRPDVIASIGGSLIPVALDYQKVLDETTPESRWVRARIRDAGDIQGAWLLSPEGAVLGHVSGFGDQAGKTLRMIEKVVQAGGGAEPRDWRKGYVDGGRGVGQAEAGTVRLAQYIRRKDGDDRIKSPVIGEVTLTGEEFASLAPPKGARVGDRWTVPEEVVGRFCRLASPMCYQHAPQKEWIRESQLEGEVMERMEGGGLRVRYEGGLRSQRSWPDGEVLSTQVLRLRGESLTDRTGALRAFLLLGQGTFRWPQEAPEKAVPFASLAEWTAKGDH